MPNYNFEYYYTMRKVRIRNQNAHHEGFFLISLRLDTQLMQYEDVRRSVGFLKLTEHDASLQDTTIDTEKTFHSVAAKGLVGHIGFLLIPSDPNNKSVVWNDGHAVSLTYSKSTTSFAIVKTFLVGRTFVSPGDNKNYRVDPASVRERRRRGE